MELFARVDLNAFVINFYGNRHGNRHGNDEGDDDENDENDYDSLAHVDLAERQKH